MITIIDYGMGNMGAVQNMLRRVGAAAQVSGNPEVVARAKKILLPGVGAFDSAMQRIESTGLRGVLDRKATVERVPILGICLGMQLLTRFSEEGNLPGLGWIAASTTRFPHETGLKVPHMGWNVARPTAHSPLTSNLGEDPRFYFVHSYYVRTDDPRHSIMRCTYGCEFDAGVASDNIYGVQFHPEKSHRFGMQILKNFAELPC